MNEYIGFWFAQHIVNLIIFAVVVLPLAIGCLWQMVKESWKQSKCPHESYRESMRCHAICCNCGKDMGFIGTIRESGVGREV